MGYANLSFLVPYMKPPEAGLVGTFHAGCILLSENAFCFPFVNNLICHVLKAETVLAKPAQELQQTHLVFPNLCRTTY